MSATGHILVSVIFDLRNVICMTGAVSVGIVAGGCAILHMSRIDCDTSGSLLWGVVNLFVLLKLGPTSLR